MNREFFERMEELLLACAIIIGMTLIIMHWR
jgi:hypothetical protein